MNDSTGLGMRGRMAIWSAHAAAWASRTARRGNGSMIGGLVALTIDPQLLTKLGRNRRTVVITGTNGKSTTTRMTAAALAALGEVATQTDGANMDAGIAAALIAAPTAPVAALEVDELHVPHVCDAVAPAALVLLNLSRDQLDRVGEIAVIERRLRAGIARHPDCVVIANCDDVLVTSAAYDAANVVWVAAGSSWAADSTSCPRSGEPIVRNGTDWYSTGAEFRRPTPDWWMDSDGLHGPSGESFALEPALPGKANRGNAAQAVAAAVALGGDAAHSVAAVSAVTEVAGRYRTRTVGPHTVRMLLAKNPAGWQEALSMLDPTADGLVIAVNGQIPDGEDLSWLWDVRFEHFDGVPVIASGERATDLAVRLEYADVRHTTVANPFRAIASCPPGRVEVLANYTAFRDLNTQFTALDRRGGGVAPPTHIETIESIPGGVL